MMTSGSVISVRKALEIGGFDERLFIDEVDHEICYRAVGAGFSLFQSSDVFLSHQLGNPIVWHTIFGTVRTLNHSPFRRSGATGLMFGNAFIKQMSGSSLEVTS